MAGASILERGGSYWLAVLGVSLLKLMLINSYRSTDFEVHRNWLALTHSLPLEKWYYEKTSEWTLDYPPFFAYFEWMLSQAAKFFDPAMLKVSNLKYASFETILFQKLSVILVDLVLAYSVLKCSSISAALSSSKPTRSRGSGSSKGAAATAQLNALFVLIFLNGGLFMVDHIHFQYNGFLFGMLLLAIAQCVEGKYYHGAFIFAALINFKHIFLYMAPAFGVYLLRRQCFPQNTPIQPKRLLTTIGGFALVGVSILAASFGPFYKHIPQILSRLFPFQRGLSHAYWAPNFWAPYNTLDWICNIVFQGGTNTATSGLVGERQFLFLPHVGPTQTFFLTLGFVGPVLYKLWCFPTEKNFVSAVVVTGWTSFMFGYHVHEKAILNVLIPFSLIALKEPRLYFLTLVSGTVSLFPLLFTPIEIVLKGVIAILHFGLTLQVLPKVKFSRLELIYLIGFVPVYLFENLGPVWLPQLPFLPLMLVSDYTFLGIAYSYGIFYWNFIDKGVMPGRGIKGRQSDWDYDSDSDSEETKQLESPSPKKSRMDTETKQLKAPSPKKSKMDSVTKKPKSPSSAKKSKVVTPPPTPTRVLRKRK